MEKLELRNILLKTAVFAMSVDGEIHKNEIAEFDKIAEKTSYFDEINYKEKMESFIKNINDNFEEEVFNYYEELREKDFSVVEILLIFEVLIKIIKADEVIKDSEEKFINNVRNVFKYISDDIFISRFGEHRFFLLDKEKDVTFKELDFKGKIDLSKFTDVKLKIKDGDNKDEKKN